MKYLTPFLLLFSVFGCSDHTYKYYEFDSGVVQTVYGVSGAGLSGKFKKVSSEPQITTFGNPYDFIVTFTTDVESNIPIAVKNIVIESNAPNSNILYKFDGGKFNSSWSNYQRQWFSHWTIKDINIEHVPFNVQYDLIFKVGDEHKKVSINKSYIPKYREEKSNDFWDAIMSV